MLNFESPAFLRRVLLADAVSAFAMGAMLIVAAGMLEPLLGLPSLLLREAGFVLLPIAAFVAYAGLRKELSRRLVWAVIVCNALWVADSFILLFSGWVSPTVPGQVFVAGQAVVVAVFAELEFFGVRRARLAAAA
jgi:CHASE2 domain-containing sensor protein